MKSVAAAHWPAEFSVKTSPRVFLSPGQVSSLRRAHRLLGGRRDGDRGKAILMLNKGGAFEEIADDLFLDDNTVRNWFRTFVSEGLEGLKRDYHQGRFSKLECSQMEVSLDDDAFEKLLGKAVLSQCKHLWKNPEALRLNEAVVVGLKLRRLHVEMDTAAFAWEDILLQHDFYAVDYSPENDRVRYTIHPDARPEVLKRVVGLNHAIHAEEVAKGLWEKKSGGSGMGIAAKAAGDGSQLGLFGEEDENVQIASQPKATKKEGATPTKADFSFLDGLEHFKKRIQKNEGSAV